MRHNTLRYSVTDQALYQALSRYPITDKTVLIIGSEAPVYEAVALCYGAAEVRGDCWMSFQYDHNGHTVDGDTLVMANNRIFQHFLQK